ncbi:hypothetical protein [Halorhabdus sp. BNX81]|uniref:hypothetical protein n=1 Tax=Halorhabdus sp. BNX81 TaxID=2980181 RepID=UPI0023DCF0AA|nr:hypothetical protein [Halorhabdus sp. BNX81]WEL22851.1 hypothetical protein HBNXHr_2822 [Halorhabdus sp. BNX81]
MNVAEYVPADQPLVVARRIGPRVLFLVGCLLGGLTVLRASSLAGIQTGSLGAGVFALAFAATAGRQLAGDQHIRAVPSGLTAVAVGTMATGTVPGIDPAAVTLVMTGVYFVWLVIGSITQVGIYQDEELYEFVWN